MPKLDIRLTERQKRRLFAEAAAAGMNASDWVRYCCLREEPGRARRAAQFRRSAELRGRADAVKAETAPPPRPKPKPPEPVLSTQMVAMQAGVTFAHADELIREGRVRLENGHLLVDDRPV
jgi:hypothetical protein